MTDIGERVATDLLTRDWDTWAPILAPDGHAAQRQWTTEDGWIITYTTERVREAFRDTSWNGRFVVMAYRPRGAGARSGRNKASEWRRAYARAFSTRKAAKARAMDLYAEHSPKWFARVGRFWR